MKKYLLLSSTLILLASSCQVETIDLGSNVLTTDFVPISIDSIEDVTTNPNANFRTFYVHFTPHLEELTPEQQALVTGYVMYENGVYRNTYEPSRRSFIRSNIAKGTEFTWEMALDTDAGPSKKSPSFTYKVQ